MQEPLTEDAHPLPQKAQSARLQPDFQAIYVEKKIYEDAFHLARAQAILSRFPRARVIEVESHWKIPELVAADPKEWIRTKKDVLILGVRSSFRHTVNGRSADYIAASYSNGCLSSCQYCYVARRKGGSNPLSLFVNIDQIADAIDRHQQRLGPKLSPNQTDPALWTYDIGCNADLSVDALLCDFPGDLIERFGKMKHAKATFATKTVNDEYWLRFDPRGHTRIRYSIMPTEIARFVDIRTSPIADRIRSIDRLVEGGYEVHLNFSPIIIYGGEKWKEDWERTFQMIDDSIGEKAKQQLACEAFFLTHSDAVHELNLEWNPKGESYLWYPEIQVPKLGKPDVLVYDYALKKKQLEWFHAAVRKYLPYCKIRYSF